MRPRRAEQSLPQEGATPKRDAGAPLRAERDHGIPSAARSPLRGSLGRRFGAPFHSKELQRSAVPQKLFNPPCSEYEEGEAHGVRKILSILFDYSVKSEDKR
ncbi:hypothetical protein SAMN05216315_12430 [Nitrosospira sp. Nsp18]|uniref:hypothetical protein n=1 Tax=Nitrosospira sp. Nsp18 TaxID=1855334 RepID=UPI00088CBB80|nr:hypothetical protein [Nitrosospira sp. Nsp18]SDA24434.1 hypothetical protein SAMN05216315_12430 [Nitrosospira sp. Nsp18]